ncbi:MAG: YigZ family protein, partial [Deltaproteobacteria bacterium]|nr:YigZ family protein [Deltaproteobacteria bacterium]
MLSAPLAQAKYTLERSRFYALLYAPRDETEIKALLTARKRALKRACHHCWASRRVADGQLIEQARDDGEVGRPGTKILAVMRRYEIEGVLIVSR